MYRLFKYVSVVVLTCVFAAGAHAQAVDLPELPDSLDVAADSLAAADSVDYGDSFDDDSTAVADTNKMRQKDYGIDAVKLSLQKRYRPKNQLFVNKKWSDNTFFSIHGGGLSIFPLDIPQRRFVEGVAVDKDNPGVTLNSDDGVLVYFSPVSFVGIDYGKWLTWNNALRWSLQGETYIRNTDNRRFLNIGLDVSHLFNMSAYIGGYSQTRFCELSTVLGLGYRASMSIQKKTDIKRYGVMDISHTFNVHAGFNVSMKVGRHTNVFFEPLVYLNNSKPLLYFNEDVKRLIEGEVDRRYYTFTTGAKMGVTFNVIPKEAARPRISHKGFISLSGGLQLQNSDLVYNKVGWMRSMGPHAMISYGNIYPGNFGLRASLFASMHVWNIEVDQYHVEHPLYGYYGGFRLELMYDFIKLAKHLKPNFPLSFSLLVGPEVGVIYKDDELDTSLKHAYLGLTGGCQLKVRIAGPVSFFIEPRFSFVPYSHPVTGAYDHDDFRKNYYDMLLNGNAGLEFSLERKSKEERAEIAARKEREKMAKKMEKEAKKAGKAQETDIQETDKPEKPAKAEKQKPQKPEKAVKPEKAKKPEKEMTEKERIKEQKRQEKLEKQMADRLAREKR